MSKMLYVCNRSILKPPDAGSAIKRLIQRKGFRNEAWEGDLLEAERGTNRREKKNSKLSNSDGVEYLYGLHPVQCALKQKKRNFFKLYYKETANPKLDSIVNKCKELKIPTSERDGKFLSRFVPPDRPHQGVIAEVSKMELKTIFSYEELLCQKRLDNESVWVIPWEVHDPMNLGNILRTSFFFGITGCLLPAKNCCTVTPVVSKASSGAAEIMDILRISNAKDFLRELRKSGCYIIGTCKTGSLVQNVQPLEGFIRPMNKPIFILLGNEGSGLPDEIKEQCSALVSISGNPADEDVDSLNVTAAASVILYHLSRKRDAV